MKAPMTIGDVSRETGLPSKTLRYYEDIGLVRPHRLDNGYRTYDPADLERLRFLKRARSLGFTIEECRSLIDLQDNPNRSNAEVRRLALAHIEALDHKIGELAALRQALEETVSLCTGDGGPDCAILEDLASDQSRLDRPGGPSQRAAVPSRS